MNVGQGRVLKSFANVLAHGDHQPLEQRFLVRKVPIEGHFVDTSFSRYPIKRGSAQAVPEQNRTRGPQDRSALLRHTKPARVVRSPFPIRINDIHTIRFRIASMLFMLYDIVSNNSNGGPLCATPS